MSQNFKIYQPVTAAFGTFTETCTKVRFVCQLFLHRRNMTYFIFAVCWPALTVTIANWSCTNRLFSKSDRKMRYFAFFSNFILPTSTYFGPIFYATKSFLRRISKVLLKFYYATTFKGLATLQYLHLEQSLFCLHNISKFRKYIFHFRI